MRALQLIAKRNITNVQAGAMQIGVEMIDAITIVKSEEQRAKEQVAIIGVASRQVAQNRAKLLFVNHIITVA